jgi:hypothetical protein
VKGWFEVQQNVQSGGPLIDAAAEPRVPAASGDRQHTASALQNASLAVLADEPFANGIRIEFDAEYYLSAYPDVKHANLDPFEHYWLFGQRGSVRNYF